jgi:hypothetical protein
MELCERRLPANLATTTGSQVDIGQKGRQGGEKFAKSSRYDSSHCHL